MTSSLIEEHSVDKPLLSAFNVYASIGARFAPPQALPISSATVLTNHELAGYDRKPLGFHNRIRRQILYIMEYISCKEIYCAATKTAGSDPFPARLPWHRSAWLTPAAPIGIKHHIDI